MLGGQASWNQWKSVRGKTYLYEHWYHIPETNPGVRVWLVVVVVVVLVFFFFLLLILLLVAVLRSSCREGSGWPGGWACRSLVFHHGGCGTSIVIGLRLEAWNGDRFAFMSLRWQGAKADREIGIYNIYIYIFRLDVFLDFSYRTHTLFTDCMQCMNRYSVNDTRILLGCSLIVERTDTNILWWQLIKQWFAFTYKVVQQYI